MQSPSRGENCSARRTTQRKPAEPDTRREPFGAVAEIANRHYLDLHQVFVSVRDLKVKVVRRRREGGHAERVVRDCLTAATRVGGRGFERRRPE